MWVACLPLLQPTGMCICKAGLPTRAHSHRQAHTDAKHTATVNCSCRGCRNERGRSPETPSPAPADDSHLPGCPASPGVDRYKWADPAPSLISLLPPVTFVAVLPDLPATKPMKAAGSARIWPSDPPLYLSHCTLVI